MDVKSLFPIRAQENDLFTRVISEPTARELEGLKPFIDAFPDLISVDYVSPQFIGLLGDFLGFDYLETEPVEVQREIMKRVVDEYHKKGSIEGLYKACNRAFDTNYFLGDMTYYHGKIEEGYSHISYPRDRMFRYDYSQWDNGDRWPDYWHYTHGVMDIDLSKCNERTLEYLEKMVPGGIKYYVNHLRDMSPSGDADDPNAVLFPMIALLHEAIVWYDAAQTGPYVPTSDFFRWDYSKWDNAIYHGRLIESHDIWTEKAPQASIHWVLFPTDAMYCVESIADDKFSYNEARFFGFIDGKTEEEEPTPPGPIPQHLKNMKWDNSIHDMNSIYLG